MVIYSHPINWSIQVAFLLTKYRTELLVMPLQSMYCMFVASVDDRMQGLCLFYLKLSVCWQDVDAAGLVGYKKSIMALSDGGKLYRTELEIVLCRDSTLWPPCLGPCYPPHPHLPPPLHYCFFLPTSWCILVHVWPLTLLHHLEWQKCSWKHTVNRWPWCFSFLPL